MSEALQIILLLVVFAMLALAFGFVMFSLQVPLVRGAPFVPSRSRDVKRMIRLAEIRPGERAADLGSGTGRLVLALARAGAEAHGYEINPLLVWWSRARIRLAGLQDRAVIHWGSYWTEDLSSCQLVAIYGITELMPEMEAKLWRELPPGARVVSNKFQFPHWFPEKSEESIFLYRQKTGDESAGFSSLSKKPAN